jgi:hypothetical protein
MLPIDDSDKQHLDRRFERVGWGLFLVMIGGLWLLPGVQPGVWLVGTGLIMLGLNAARNANGIPASTFTLILGTAAIVLGVSEMMGTAMPVFPILLIVIGASIVWRTAMARERAPSASR